jgi:hypothetical protein
MMWRFWTNTQKRRGTSWAVSDYGSQKWQLWENLRVLQSRAQTYPITATNVQCSSSNNLLHKECSTDVTFTRLVRKGRGHDPQTLWEQNDFYSIWWGPRWRCATNRQVAGSIPDGVSGIFHWNNPVGRTMALGSTQPLTEMSTRNISWGVNAAGA